MLSSEEGATAIEYGLLVGLIGVVSIGTLSRLGKRQRRNLNCINRALRGRAQSRFCERRTA
ncbi:MAG: Flp family type IVb pilin [Pseudomonadota bacterium]